MTEISNYDDVIDSRDVIARIAELVEMRDDEEGDELTEDDAAELAELEALASALSGYSDWGHGATLIRDSYFVEYAQECFDDMEGPNRLTEWPYSCIDWEQAARELRMDYTAAEFGDITYWVR